MLSSIGGPGLLLLALLALVVFGPRKLPELGRAIGRTLHEFKRGARDLTGGDSPASAPEELPRKAGDGRP